MTTSRDDDGLHWVGDDDPTLSPPIQAGVAPAEQADTPTVLEQAELAEDATVEAELAAAEKASAQLSSAALITLGIVGGIYLLYTIGWGIVAIRPAVTLFELDNILLEISFRIGQVLTVAAAPLWFVSVFLLTARRSWRSRLGWLLLGVFVLVPWPFVQGA
jgi:hypothetical protein